MTETVDWHALAVEEGLYLEKNKVKERTRRDVKGSKKSRVVNVEITWSSTKRTLWANGVEYRILPSNHHYYISADGDVRNEEGKRLTGRVTSSDSKVRLRKGVKDTPYYRFKLVFEAWPELAPVWRGTRTFDYDGEEFKKVRGFPDYFISVSGRVIRMKNFTFLRNNKGRVYLSKDGRQVSRAARRLVMETFGRDLEVGPAAWGH